MKKLLIISNAHSGYFERKRLNINGINSFLNKIPQAKFDVIIFITCLSAEHLKEFDNIL